METRKDHQEVSSPRQFYQTMAIGATLLVSWAVYYYTRPLANVITSNDTSDSIVLHKKAAIQGCEQIKDRLIDGDRVVKIGFADKSAITGNATYSETSTKLDCNNITTKPAGVGKQDGTNIIGVLKTASLVERNIRAQGNKQPVVLFLTIQAAEPQKGKQVFDPKVVKQLLQQITKNGYAVIIGSEVFLQSVLSQELVDLPQVKICSFDDAKECGIDWAFDKVRKYPWQ